MSLLLTPLRPSTRLVSGVSVREPREHGSILHGVVLPLSMDKRHVALTEHMQVVVDGQTLPRAARTVGFNALGVKVTFDNCFEEELQNRIVFSILLFSEVFFIC